MSDAKENIQHHESDSTKSATTLFGAVSILIFLSLAFIIPLGLWFGMVYTVSGGVVNSLLLFFGIYGLALLVTLLYYRMGVQDDIEAKVDKISSGKVKSIMATTFASFCILLITLLVLAMNPELVTIFENTVGIWILGVLGHSGFLTEVFKSELFSQLQEESPKMFNQNFLLTCFSNDNIGPFMEYYKKHCSGEAVQNETNVSLPFDFRPHFTNEGQLFKLRSLVAQKRTIGYFTWVYLTSIVSLVISITSATMKTM